MDKAVWDLLCWIVAVGVAFYAGTVAEALWTKAMLSRFARSMDDVVEEARAKWAFGDEQVALDIRVERGLVSVTVRLGKGLLFSGHARSMGDALGRAAGRLERWLEESGE